MTTLLTSVGVIGGADGPTSIIVSDSNAPGLVEIVIVVAVIAVIEIIIRKRRDGK